MGDVLADGLSSNFRFNETGFMRTMPNTIVDLAYQIGSTRKFLVIRGEVLSHIASFRQTRPWHKEAGGQLFGTFENCTVTIRHATGPYPSDQRSRNRFTPCVKLENRDNDRHYDMGQHYIGNWHTHPEDILRPSRIDLTNTRQRFLESDHELLSFTMVIAGRAAFHPDCKSG